MSKCAVGRLALSMLGALLVSSAAWSFTWEARADLGPGSFGFGRGFHGGGTIDNLIYVAGGGFIGTSLQGSETTGEVYDPVTNSWSPLPMMTLARTKPASAVANFRGSPQLFVVGGYDVDDFTDIIAHRDIAVYDPLSNLWRRTGDGGFGGASWGMCAVTVDNRIYIMGGAGSLFLSLTDRVVSYEPDTDSYQAHARMPAVASDGSCAVVGRKIYWFGGYGALGWGTPPSNRIYVYDVDADSWTTATSVTPTARADAAAIALDGKIYVVGGWDGRDAYSGMFASVDVYDPAADSWTASLPDPLACPGDDPASGIRGRSGLTLHLANDGSADRVYAVGGNIGISVPTTCNEASALPGDDVAPPVFGGLTAAYEATDCPDPEAPVVRLEWDAASDATPPVTYNVYRGTTPGFPADAGSLHASGLTGTSYEDMLAASDCGLSYFYLVRAQDGALPPNEDTNDVRIGVDITCPSAPTPPAAIGNLLRVVKDASRDPRLDWSDYVPSLGVTHYHVYRSALKSTIGAVLYEPTVQEQLDAAASGPRYFYDVRSATDCMDLESED